MNHEERISRLLQLADLLENLQEEKFDFSAWTRIKDVTFAEHEDAKLGCGTTGCAMGWAITLPFAQEQGYKYEVDRLRYALTLKKNGKITDHYFSAAELFGLNFQDVSLLFTEIASAYSAGTAEKKVTPKIMAAAIRKFCGFLPEEYGNNSTCRKEDIFPAECIGDDEDEE